MLLGGVSLTISGGIRMLVVGLISSRKYGVAEIQKEPRIQETMVFLSILQENVGVVLLGTLIL